MDYRSRGITLHLVRVLSVRTQVVAGMHYIMSVLVKQEVSYFVINLIDSKQTVKRLFLLGCISSRYSEQVLYN